MLSINICSCCTVFVAKFGARARSCTLISRLPILENLKWNLNLVYATTATAVSRVRVREFSSFPDKQTAQVRIPGENGDGSKAKAQAQIGTRRPKQDLVTRRSPGTMTTNGQGTNVGAGNHRDTDDAIIWIDCEMTGLDVETDLIMEVACIITNSNLDEIARLPSIVLNVPQEKLQSMNAWCVSHHGESGLTEDCKKSHMTTAEAEKMLLAFVQKHTRTGACPVGGNSICMDRVFLQKYMPNFYAHFHYRSIDVSTIKELVRRWFPKDYNAAGSRKRWSHRTMADIEDSINELRFYKSNVFKQP